MFVYPTADINPEVAETNYMSVFASNTDNTSNGDFQLSVKPGGGQIHFTSTAMGLIRTK